MKISVFSFILFTAVGFRLCESADWCYDKNDPNCGPSSTSWSQKCNDGTAQSPIDIPSIPSRVWDIPISGSPETISFNEAYKEGLRSAFMRNDGHTVLIEATKDQTSRMILQTTIFPDPYVFGQVHCHWDSEHRFISSSKFLIGPFGSDSGSPKISRSPLECHFVHYNATYGNITEALKTGEKGALLIIGVLYETKRGSRNMYNPPMAAFTKNLRHFRKVSKGDRTVRGEVNFYKMLSYLNVRNQLASSIDMYSYTGSLTTPYCNEGMHWLVMRERQILSEAQMREFRAVLGDGDKRMRGNYREPQPLNGRKITPLRLHVSK